MDVLPPRPLILILILTFFGAVASAESKPWHSEDWTVLRELGTAQLRDLNKDYESPRYRLMLALHEIDSNVEEATEQLERALSGVTPGSDEARLAGMLHCSFSELLGTPISVPDCARHGEAIDGISHPLPSAIAQIHYGIWLAINGRYTESFRANRVAEELALAAGDTRLAANTQNNQGMDYLSRGLPVQALKKFQAALEHVRTEQAPDNDSFLTTLTSNIASTHLELGDFESANVLLQSLTTSGKYDRYNPANLIDEVILARASLALNRAQEGHDRLSEVLEALGTHGTTATRAMAYSVIGELQIALGRVDEGVQSFALAREYGQRSGDPLRASKVDIAFADVLVDLDRYAEAERIIESSIELLSQNGPSMMLAQALDLRGEILKAAGQRSAAKVAKQQARQIQLKVAGTEHDMELVMLGRSLELANKANELANARQEVKQSEARAQRDITLRNQLILTALLLALITYLGLSRRYERRVAKTIQIANSELEAKVSERTAALELEMAERLKAESARQSLAQNLAENEKLQALGQLTSGVAHDFNNLMTVVTLSAGQLREVARTAGSESVRDVDNILSAAESASDITASLLAYARKQPLAPQPTHLDSFLFESLPLLESTLGKGMRLDTNIQPCTVLVDRSQLITAIINLLLNAKEAQHGTGSVSLHVEELVQVSERGEPQEWARISVTDHGEGMDPAELRRATEPFFTTKAAGHGTGLGLSMVHGFAEQSGGSLDIESTKGEGTVVTIAIPPCTAEGLVRGVASIESRDVPPDGLVIVVDDQKAIRDVLSRLLEQMGLETLSAGSGVEALQLLEQSQHPSLLITDLMMPGDINGQQLVIEVRRRYPSLPMLMMSGYTNSVEMDVEFLHKPFSLDDLREAIVRAISHQQAA